MFFLMSYWENINIAKSNCLLKNANDRLDYYPVTESNRISLVCRR